MEVLVGPTSYASTAYVIDPTEDGSSPCLFLNGDEEEDGGATADEIRKRIGSGFLGKSPEEESSDSGSSSSIGAPGDSEEEEEDDGGGGEVSSQLRGSGGLASLDALENSLPIKRGLSNHYTGKSKSFGNLSDVSLSTISVKDLEKPENAFNKRRRVLIANKWARKSFYSWQNPKSMPLLASLNEDDADDDEYCNNRETDSNSSSSSSNSKSDQQRGHKLKKHPLSFKSKSCFALADLQEEGDDDDDDDDE